MTVLAAESRRTIAVFNVMLIVCRTAAERDGDPASGVSRIPALLDT